MILLVILLMKSIRAANILINNRICKYSGMLLGLLKLIILMRSHLLIVTYARYISKYQKLCAEIYDTQHISQMPPIGTSQCNYDWGDVKKFRSEYLNMNWLLIICFLQFAYVILAFRNLLVTLILIF